MVILDSNLTKFEQGGDYTGRLMVSEPDKNAGLRHYIWFKYNRELFNRLHDGDILAAESFTDEGDTIWHSLMEIVATTPSHFAMGRKPSELGSSYPEFLMEVASEGYQDWMSQRDRSHDQTTKVLVEAVPLRLQMTTSREGHQVVPERRSRAMPGAPVNITTLEFAQALINQDHKETEPQMIVPGGNLAAPNSISAPILLDASSFMRKHFGIFGFTGVGKSNLLNRLIALLLDARHQKADGSEDCSKIVLFDLMDEYKTLLIDQLTRDSIDGRYITLGEQSLPTATANYLALKPKRRDPKLLEDATSKFQRQFLLPHSLGGYGPKLKPAIRELLDGGTGRRVSRLDLSSHTPVRVFVEEFAGTLTHQDFTPTAVSIAVEVKRRVFESRMDRDLDNKVIVEMISDIDEILADQDGVPWDKAGTAIRNRVEGLRRILNQRREEMLEPQIPEGLRSTPVDIVKGLGDRSKPSLYIISSADAGELQRFARFLTAWVFNTRRKNGENSPQVSFIFDEADEFMPRQPRGDQQASKEAVERLSRRGRKFGLGVGIATQRIAYLDTNSLGQIHSYFVSRLPRDYDRHTIAEAFSLPDQAFDQTFQFAPGDWMLLSHEATGLKGRPILLHADDSEERLRKYLDSFKSTPGRGGDTS